LWAQTRRITDPPGAGGSEHGAALIQHAFDLIEEAEQASVARLHEVWPELSETEARRIYRNDEDDD